MNYIKEEKASASPENKFMEWIFSVYDATCKAVEQVRVGKGPI